MLAQSCLGFEMGCETMLKGGLAVIMAFVLFVGSVLIVLAAVFGRRMGYLVLAVSFFGWLIILSSLWTFGFFSQGLDTPVNLGPRGAEPAWVVEASGSNDVTIRRLVVGWRASEAEVHRLGTEIELGCVGSSVPPPTPE